MAGSRLDKIGTIFSRASGLLKSGAVKYQDRPVWYDIYRVFPPKYEPHFDRQAERTPEQIPQILYKEDKPRAEFFKRFGLNPSGEVRHLTDLTFEEKSQEFIKKCQDLEKNNPDWPAEKVFETTAEDFQASRPYSARSAERDGVSGGTGRSRTGRVGPYQRTDPSKFSANSLGDEESGGLDAEDEPRVVKRERKIPIITAESLRSLFEEAKDKQTLEKESKNQSQTSKDTEKS